jgi:hypothetical protein
MSSTDATFFLTTSVHDWLSLWIVRPVDMESQLYTSLAHHLHCWHGA